MQIVTQKLPDLKAQIQNHAQTVEHFLDLNFKPAPGVQDQILTAMRYSLLQSGAKRFRANLACLTVQALGAKVDDVVPYAAALECVHAYSLIHDDLPSLDNDDVRRGKPTNHKVFGEANALLAGDALLTEAFSIIANHYQSRPAIGLELVAVLSKAAGIWGMISGQVRDLDTKITPLKEIAELKLMHEQKTGALILAAVKGAGIVAKASPTQKQELESFGQILGLAFQVKDDLLDYSEDKGMSYTKFMGFDGTQKYLQELTETCLTKLANWDHLADSIRQMATYNLSREK